MRSSLPDAVTIAALRQLVARSYEALTRPVDEFSTAYAELLGDLRAVIDASSLSDPSGRTEVALLSQLEPGDEFFPLVERYKLPTWRGRVEAHLDDDTTHYTLFGHRSEPCYLRSSYLDKKPIAPNNPIKKQSLNLISFD